MAGKKLTQQARIDTTRAFLKKVFEKDIEALDKRRAQIADAIYRTFVTQEQERIMRTLPKEFFNYTDTCPHGIFVERKTKSDERPRVLSTSELGHQAIDQAMGDEHRYRHASMSRECPIPRAVDYGHREHVVDPKVFGLLDQFDKDHKALAEKISQARSKALSVMHSVGTIDNLVKVWPEIEPFIPEEAKVVAGKMLPAPIVADLNTLLKKAA